MMVNQSIDAALVLHGTGTTGYIIIQLYCEVALAAACGALVWEAHNRIRRHSELCHSPTHQWASEALLWSTVQYCIH